MTLRPYAPCVKRVRHGLGPDVVRGATLEPATTALDLVDPARIDVGASRSAGEPRRAPASTRVVRRASASRAPLASTAPRTIVLRLHDADGAGRWGCAADLVDVLGSEGVRPPVAPPADHRSPLAGSDADLARLRAAVLDLHAALSAWPREGDERILLLASGVAAAGVLVALGAGLAAGAGGDDPLRRELLLDLREGDPLHELVVEEVAPRIAGAVLIDPAGAPGDWRDVALARIATPVALLERGGPTGARRLFDALLGSDRLHVMADSDETVTDLVAAWASRPADAPIEEVAAGWAAIGRSEARHARGAMAEAFPTEICRSDVAHDLLRLLRRAALGSAPRPGWS